MQEATDCMKKIKHSCSANTLQMQIIRQIVNMKRWMIVTKNLCDNIDYVIENKDCMKNEGRDMNTCMKKASTGKKGASGLLGSLFQLMNLSKLLSYSCGYMTKMKDCTIGMENCPEQMKDIIKMTTFGLLPPLCDDELPEEMKKKLDVDYYDYDVSGSGSFVHGSAVIVFLTAVSSGFSAL